MYKCDINAGIWRDFCYTHCKQRKKLLTPSYLTCFQPIRWHTCVDAYDWLISVMKMMPWLSSAFRAALHLNIRLNMLQLETRLHGGEKEPLLCDSSESFSAWVQMQGFRLVRHQLQQLSVRTGKFYSHSRMPSFPDRISISFYLNIDV